MAIKLHPSLAVHPDEWLRAEVVGPAGLSAAELAERLHVTHWRRATCSTATPASPLNSDSLPEGVRPQGPTR
jgi:hypothetical protein